jgi:hypothetical protein
MRSTSKNSQNIQRKRQAPACIFPVHRRAGHVVWFEIEPSGYGLSVTVHQQRPRMESASQVSQETVMATVHVDYFGADGEPAQIKVHLWGEHDDDPGWDIVLVADVEQWSPPKDGDGEA